MQPYVSRLAWRTTMHACRSLHTLPPQPRHGRHTGVRRNAAAHARRAHTDVAAACTPAAVTALSSSSSAASDAAAGQRGRVDGTSTTTVGAAQTQLSLNHVQRLLRRLPVGESSMLFHYNELPSNVQARMPSLVQQHMRVTEEAAAAAAVPTRGDEHVCRQSRTNGSILLTLAQPQLTVSETTLQACANAARAERRRLRRARMLRRSAHELEKPRLDTTAQHTPPPPPPPPTSATTATSTVDPLLHLSNLEEPCLLLPETRHAVVSLGLAVSRCGDTHARGAADTPRPAAAKTVSSPTSVVDEFYLGLTCSSTAQHVDYATQPVHYVLGVPTALLHLVQPVAASGGTDPGTSSGAGSCCEEVGTSYPPSLAPPPLARWLVFDSATSQVLLRRGGGTAPRVHAAPAAAPPSSTLSYAAALEEQVFLAHTYCFDPASACDAARGAAAPLYTLFFFSILGRAQSPTMPLSPLHAAALYPASFASFIAELPTTEQLAADVAAAQPPTPTPTPLASAAAFFPPLSGKRLRVCANAASPTGAHLWTAQVESRSRAMDGGAGASLAAAAAAAAAAGGPGGSQSSTVTVAEDHVAADVPRHAQVRHLVSDSFRTWQATVTATAAARSTSGVLLSKGIGALHSPRAGVSATAGLSKSGAAGDDPQREGPSVLEAQLEAESAALVAACGDADRAREWGAGLRWGRVVIAVATPLVPARPRVAAAAAAAAAAERASAGVASHTHAATCVADAPLADALWTALCHGPDASASPTARRVLAMAEDRRTFARERVLLPYLLLQPRQVPPDHDPHRSAGFSGSSAPHTRAGGTAAASGVCPLLWRLGELPELCGWRQRSRGVDGSSAFGSFCDLLPPPMYVTVGRRTPALLSGPLSPVVLFSDVAYVERVLLPAMRSFAEKTCRCVAGGLHVYRRFGERDGGAISDTQPTRRASPHTREHGRCTRAAVEDGPADPAATVAVEVALHHRRLSRWLRALQRAPRTLLQRWIDAVHGRTALDGGLDAQVRQAAGGAPAAFLQFLVGVDPPAPTAGPLPTPASELCCSGGATAVALSAAEVDRRVDRVRSLTPDDIAVVPLLDFVVWGSVCSDFSAASAECLDRTAAERRDTLDPVGDGATMVKYCMRYPQHICCAGGCDATVAVLRPQHVS